MKKYYSYDDKELTPDEVEEIQALNECIWESVEKGTMDFNCLKYINFVFGFKEEDLNK